MSPASVPPAFVVLISTFADSRANLISLTSSCVPSADGSNGFAIGVPDTELSTISMFDGSMSHVPVLPFAAVASTVPLTFMDL